MKKLILLVMILMSGMMPTWAQSAAADDIAQLQKEMYQLYNKNDETAFVDITNKLKEAAQKANEGTAHRQGYAAVCPEPRP